MGRGEHIKDHYYTILEFSKHTEYGELKSQTLPITLETSGLRSNHDHFNLDRMFRAREFYFTSLYGEVFHILLQKNLLTEEAILELNDIVKLLDKEYFIFKPIADQFKESREIYLKLLSEKEELDLLYSDFEYIKLLYHYLYNATSPHFFVLRSYTHRSGPNFSEFSLSNELNCAYLAELPFSLHVTIPKRFIKVNEENLSAFSELPFSKLEDISIENATDVLFSPINYFLEDFYLFNRSLYRDALVKYYENFSPFSNTVVSNLSEEQENLDVFSELPFSNMEDLNLSEEQENLDAFSELPFSNPEDSDFEIDDHMLEGFSELPFNNV